MAIKHNVVKSKITGGYSYFLLYPEGWFPHRIDSQHPESSKPMSLLNLLLSGVVCMCRASLIFKSRFLLDLSTTLTGFVYNSYLFPFNGVMLLPSTFSNDWNVLITSLTSILMFFTLCSSLLAVSPICFNTTAGYTVHYGWLGGKGYSIFDLRNSKNHSFA